MIKKRISSTCIAALKLNNGKIMMAADRRITWDNSQYQKGARPKINKRNGMILAGTGDCVFLTLMVDVLNIPKRKGKSRNLDTYMHHVFYPKVYKLLASRGFADHHGNIKIPSNMGAEILVAIEGKLYTIMIDNREPNSPDQSGLIDIDELALPYATGCGGQLAWGSLLTTEGSGMIEAERLKLALKVASQVSGGCDDNIDIRVED